MFFNTHGRITIPLLSLIFLNSFHVQNSVAAESQFYAALKTQIEAVSPDNETAQVSDYIGLRDAYSRIGLKINQDINKQTRLLFHLEIPVDSANLEIQDPWDQQAHKRILKLQLDTALGDVWIGQDWMPYYNTIAYPVDMFSSYYSGFATYTVFRLDDTLAYVSPEIAGIKGAAAVSKNNGNNSDDRIQLVVSGNFKAFTMSIGMDELGGTDDTRILGAALQYKLKDLYLAAKYEHFKSNAATGYGADGDVATNVFASYQHEQNTWKIMLANVEKYGEQIIHLGWDYQYTEHTKFFVEFYTEEETAAITARKRGKDLFDVSASGGTAIMSGFHYSFESSKTALGL